MPLIRYAEVVGSAAADSFQGAANTVYFGLGGNDAMVTAAGSPVTVFVGGGGSDQYTLSNNSTTVIIDLDHSGTLNAPGMSVQGRSEEHTSELQSRFGISYAVFCLKK